MISFQRLLGRQEEFFGLLEGSAAECVAAISALRAVLSQPGKKPELEAFALARRKDKEITLPAGLRRNENAPRPYRRCLTAQRLCF